MAENKQIRLHVGGILEDMFGTRYRILFCNLDYMTVCEINDSASSVITIHSTEHIREQILNNKFFFDESEEKMVFDTDKWTKEMWDDFEKKQKIFKRFVDAFGPTYYGLMLPERKPHIKEIIEEEGISKATLWRYISKYLQSGFDPYCCIDKRYYKKKVGYGTYKLSKRSGRPVSIGESSIVILDDKLKAHFNEGLKYFKEGTCTSIASAYRYVKHTFYTVPIETSGGVTYEAMAYTDVPTYKQFYNYVNNHISKKEIITLKESGLEYRNNYRALLSDSMYSVMGPGDRCQMDEVETNISLVSSVDSDQTIGRAIVYILRDIYSRIILAVGVGFDNNSIIGFTNCLQNIVEDKVEYCGRYGVKIPSPEIWPSGYLPSRILCDRGSEYTSKEAKKICNNLNITLEIVPPKLGSMKGLVESWFDAFFESHEEATEKHGGISKKYGSKHHKEACLTIDLFTKILLNFVVEFNWMDVLDYPREIEMVRDKVEYKPALLWKYGCEKYGEPIKVSNVEQFKFDLLVRERASLDRAGIHWKGLHYMNYKDRVLLDTIANLGSKSISMDVRIDPRDVGSLYYLRDNKLMRASLNERKFGQTSWAGLSKSEYEKIHKLLCAKRKKAEHDNDDKKAQIAKLNRLIVKSAIKVGASNITNMAIARNFEKALAQQRYLLFRGMDEIFVESDKTELHQVFGFTGEEAWIEEIAGDIADVTIDDVEVVEEDTYELLEDNTEEYIDDEDDVINHIINIADYK